MRLVMPRDAVDATVEPNRRRPTGEPSMRHGQQLELPSQTRAETTSENGLMALLATVPPLGVLRVTFYIVAREQLTVTTSNGSR